MDIGWRGSIQKSITDVLAINGQHPHITGFYLGTSAITPAFHYRKYPHDAYLFRLGEPREHAELTGSCIAITELLFSAPEGSVIRIEQNAAGDFVPVRSADDTDAYRYDCIQRLQEGAMQFVDEYVALKKKLPDPSISRETAIAELYRVIRHPSPVEARILGDFPHHAFGRVHPIAPTPKLHTLLRGRRAALRYDREVFWRAGRDVRLSPIHRAIFRLLTR